MPNKNYPGDYDRYLFHQGRHYESYNFLGAHLTQEKGKKGVRLPSGLQMLKKLV